mmetsp:Transcript_8849/g.27195  ORF Transcript_8849/g.27195 Transcript_8849/m.27195 type:complete len:417 (+) Transcript_8849:72-1322(+)
MRTPHVLIVVGCAAHALLLPTTTTFAAKKTPLQATTLRTTSEAMAEECEAFGDGIREEDKWFLLEPDERALIKSSIPVHYSMVDGGDCEMPVVCLHGFGVGEFHWKSNVVPLATESGPRRVYAMDWVGQGRSWPVNPQGLTVGAETWLWQLEQFVEKVALQKTPDKVILAGNSLGGFLAAVLASRRPDLVGGLCLLNAAPFWGFFPRFLDFVWDAQLPAPRFAARIGSTWFDVLKNRQTVEGLLRDVYADPESVTDELIDKIIAATRTEFGPDVFTSILFSPAPHESFDDALRKACLDFEVPVALVYGKEDPWVFPAWGQRAYRRLERRCAYYELSNTGHCPNDESPVATNLCLEDILSAFSSSSSESYDDFLLRGGPTVGLATSVREAGDREVHVHRVDGQPRTLVERACQLAWG